MKETQILILKAELLQAEITLHAMLAANKARERSGYAGAYSEESFIYLREDVDTIAERLKQLLAK